MKRLLLLMISLTGVSMTSLAGEAYIQQTDTLQRELTLQREYVPEGKQAQKAYFNPLDNPRSRRLKPIEFARNSYELSMNVAPRLFDPIENPKAPMPSTERVHLRLLGGYPTRLGFNTQILTPMGEEGTFFLGAEHLSLNEVLRADEAVLLPFDRRNRFHDTDVTLGYNYTMEERMLSVTGSFFHHRNTYYGQTPTPSRSENAELPEPFEATYPLYTLVGGNVGFDLTPAPLTLTSDWSYSLFANLGFANKQEPTPEDSGQFVQNSELTGYTEPSSHTINELAVHAGGNLAYTIAGSDWGLGADAVYDFMGKASIDPESDLKAPHRLSVDPYVKYTRPGFLLRAGVKLQLLNRGPKKFMITPDVQMSWKVTEQLGLLLGVSGGSDFYSMKDIYEQNRYALGRSSYTGYRIADLRTMVGVQVGSLNGLSMELRGGYDHYTAFSDWRVIQVPTLQIQNSLSPQYSVSTTLFRLENKGEMGNGFLTATVRYSSAFGLNLVAQLHRNFVSTPTPEENQPKINVTGIARTTLSLGASYQITDKLSVAADFEGAEGIQFELPLPAATLSVPSGGEVVTPGAYTLIATPFTHLFNARVSYKAHKNFGFSLIGTNLLNDKTQRWLHYQQPSTSIQAAVTISF
ncbi:MAG: TonB-dependent receptor [Porphyromonas sp.]|nr:TonB-dependent receptor [Porphyromonas sp.]